MSKITILRENRATRCEICHQADSYDASSNRCSRCDSAIDIRSKDVALNVQRQLANISENYEIVQPEAVSIEDSNNRYRIIYRWRSMNNIGRVLSMSFFPLLMISGNFQHLSYWVILALVYLWMIIAVLVNKTSISISNNQLIKKSGPLSLCREKVVSIDDIADVRHERVRKQDTLAIRLNSGKRLVLINNIDDQDSMKFIEQTIKEKISRKKLKWVRESMAS